MNKKFLINIFFLSLIMVNCSVQKLAVRSMSGILDNSMIALFGETDLDLAEKAIAADLKLLEGLLKTDPNNDKLLLMVSQGFGAYALGFVEDEYPERAEKLYLRGKGYGLRILTGNKNFDRALSKPIGDFEKSLQSFDHKDVPALFWTANNWASWINLNFSNPSALADLPRVQLLMKRVIQLDPSYFYGGAHLFFGTIYAARPPILGGNMKLSKEHFDKCFAFSQEKFLLPYVYFAKYYLTREFDEETFTSTLEKVLKTADDILPGQQLPNAIAKKKAAKLLEKKVDLF